MSSILDPVPDARPPWQLVPELAGATHVCALDAGRAEGWGSPPGVEGPCHSLLAADPEVVFSGGLEALKEAQAWLGASTGRARHSAVLIGALSYDLAREFGPLPARAIAHPDEPLPGVWLAGFRALYRFDPATGRGALVGSDPRAAAVLRERIRAARATPAGRAHPSPLDAPRSRTSDAEFVEQVRAVLRWIRAGDVYQVNLARRLEIASVAPRQLPRLYAALVARHPAPFAAFLDAGAHAVLSNSPERFLRVEGARVETCPIKGTRPRGASPAEDRRLARELARSAKDQAEHLMIVDLERNDLGRVCETGSVRVARLAALRSYSRVHHLVSSVQGRLRAPGDWQRLLSATFPCGSITGAPKLRAMQIIDQLEPVRRGVYTGAIGVFDAAGGIDLSIAIRTALARAGRLELALGGGIVAESDPAAELRETHDKGAAFAELWGAGA
jgi:para-aminobenzoate synthetase component I